MLPEIQALLILQERDQKVRLIENDLLKIPQEAEALKSKLKSQLDALKNAKENSQKLEAERRQLELNVQTKNQQIARYLQQQLDTRKNEEYQALANEIERAKQEIKGEDDRQMDVMEKIESATVAVVKAQALLKEAETVLADAVKKLEAKAASLKQALEEAKAKQAEALAQADESSLPRYQRLVAGKKENAIVPVRNGSCGGCHMKLTAQTILVAKGEQEVTTCDNCSRIIYWIPE